MNAVFLRSVSLVLRLVPLPRAEPQRPEANPHVQRDRQQQTTDDRLYWLFFVIWVAIGAAIGLAVRAIYQPSTTQGLAPVHPTTASWAPVFVGIVIGGLVAVAGTLYSLTAGARLVLRVSGAVRPIPLSTSS